MTLVYDRPEKTAGEPMAHALLVGVSEYTHLPGADAPPDSDKFNLKRLGSCALSAWEMCRWVFNNRDALACRLGSIRLLMSPSPNEMASLTQIGPTEPKEAEKAGWLIRTPQEVDAADWEHFVAEARAWRADAAQANREGLTIFYYAGHGLKRFGQDLITLADFTDPDAGGRLQRSCELISNFVQGMGPNDDTRAEIARNQFYFVDCCREDITDFAGLAAHPGAVWDSLNGVDDRATPVFMAAYPGARAMAIRGQTTDFCKALLSSVETAAEGPNPQDVQSRWPVTSYTLSRALESYFDRLRTGQYAPATGISFKDIPLRWLTEPPRIEFSLVVRPSDAVGATKVTLKHVKGFLDGTFPASPNDLHPYQVRSRAGIHQIQARSTESFQPYDEYMTLHPLWVELPVMLTPVAFSSATQTASTPPNADTIPKPSGSS